MNAQLTDSLQPDLAPPAVAGSPSASSAASPPAPTAAPALDASPTAAPPIAAAPSVGASPSSHSASPAAGSPPPPDRPYQLATPAPLRPAVTLGLGLPSHISGLPAFYYWKDAIVVGSYVHPAGRFSLNVTREKLDAYAKTFARMRANGVGVPILMDHTPSAAATLGWIVDVRRRGDRLLELHQFLGESARDVGLRNFVSLGIDPDFVDGRGVRYGEAIVHSAVTPTPVVPGQTAFEQAAGDDGGSADAKTITLSRAEPASQPAVEPPADPQPAGDAPRERTEPSETMETPTHADPHPAEMDAIEPSATADQSAAMPMQLALSALADAAAAKRDLAVACGGIAPAVADELFALLVRSPSGTLNILALSRGRAGDSAAASAPLALAVFDALARNHPVPPGEETSLQALSRLIPGEDDERAELRDRMIALASARR